MNDKGNVVPKLWIGLVRGQINGVFLYQCSFLLELRFDKLVNDLG